ncbi:gamma-butyrobetaine hydroxylase-like domain-containing protein [Ahrensia sp. 13_GOM-1096m]|uniref:gamma-butyrobetaine hydroxylase-like domain-containing protein n=1 Tax=Ahrensia sp. 13_GOM-1096m TaxID=1380380 RepID=UPI00047E8BFE|nr:DUF971 domain-containing protein [Ahrensia sp. 13_GOM-1096m]
MSEIWPTELRVSSDRKLLSVRFDNESAYDLPAEMLRVMSPSAEVQGHSPEQRKLKHGKKDVEIMKMEPVGNYAVRIVFDDMHDTGIFSWTYLAELGANKQAKWSEYLNELAEKGLSR